MQSKFEVLRTKAADGVNPTLRAGEDKICEAGKKGANSSSLCLLFCSVSQQIWIMSNNLKRTIYFTWSTDLNCYSHPEMLLQTHPKIMSNLSTRGPLKLTHKIKNLGRGIVGHFP